ncbi:Sensor protein ZraS [Pirellula sp. SH-Sr6A]|uniref:sensor histidine kinase n=1 Tax=Pirellula sp. SH-Sr6A TaxID=1632865 RepID=UPI00078C034E|nr:HAMP domain-containing sensor histidine kinase [Pirellula sp. SH-Sr6A]AMV31823.1 Sensor protein ZraS [Pirellula sp. SH-Sr6A]
MPLASRFSPLASRYSLLATRYSLLATRFSLLKTILPLTSAAHRLFLAADRIRRTDTAAHASDIDAIWSEWLSEQAQHLPGLFQLDSPSATPETGSLLEDPAEPENDLPIPPRLALSPTLQHRPPAPSPPRKPVPSSLPTPATQLASLISQLSSPRGSDQLLGRPAKDEDQAVLGMLLDAAHVALRAVVDRERVDQAVARRTEQAIYDFAYGLTHEINNPLANIAARAQQLLTQSRVPADQKSLATIVDQSMRAHEMLAEMMRAVKPKAWNPRVVPLSESLEPLVGRFTPLFQARQITWEVTGVDLPIRVRTEPAELQEAIASLLQNALDACSPGDTVTLQVRASANPARHVSLTDPAFSQLAAPNASNPTVEIAVQDTGCGMSATALEKAFSLYYSGREHGRGLGISLANVRRVITASGGQIQLTSQPDAGTKVLVSLPRCARK